LELRHFAVGLRSGFEVVESIAIAALMAFEMIGLALAGM
jgi:hypothetical protein